MTENLKIKPLTKEQIIISVDRLTRFKPVEDKYLRVFKDIICSNLISPKFKKNDIEKLEYLHIVNIINQIFDYSLKNLQINSKTDYSINNKILNYEKKIFKFDKNTEILLNNKINYDSIIPLLKTNLSPNLKWLKHIKNENPRLNFSTKFPIEKIIIAEGITEEILLPIFAEKYGKDFDKEGIMLISAGGKNQVVKLFYKFADILKLPICVLLDCDAKSNLNEIKPKLRENDNIHILKGEFEDLLTLNLIKRTINKTYKNYFSIKISDLRCQAAMTKTLEELLKTHGFEFKKAEFANMISENIKKSDLTQDIKDIFTNLNL